MISEAFKERMRPLLGSAFEDFIGTYDRPAQGGLRVNTLKISKEEFPSIHIYCGEGDPLEIYTSQPCERCPT